MRTPMTASSVAFGHGTPPRLDGIGKINEALSNESLVLST